jgi:hypothetical protein
MAERKTLVLCGSCGTPGLEMSNSDKAMFGRSFNFNLILYSFDVLALLSINYGP